MASLPGDLDKSSNKKARETRFFRATANSTFSEAIGINFEGEITGSLAPTSSKNPRALGSK